MTDSINVELRGDRVLGVQMEAIPLRVRAQLFEVIKQNSEIIEARARAGAPRKTGDLQGRIHSRVFNEEKKIVGIVFVGGEFAKAAAFEYGSHGDFGVKGHFQKLDHVFNDRLKSPLLVFVDSYQRQGGLAAYRFMRGPAQSMEAEIVTEMREAVEHGVTGGSA